MRPGIGSDSSCSKTRRPWFVLDGHVTSGFSIYWSCRWSVPDRPDTKFVCLGIIHWIHQKPPYRVAPAYQWAVQSDSQTAFQKRRSWNSCHFRSAPIWSVIYISPNYKRWRILLSFSCWLHGFQGSVAYAFWTINHPRSLGYSDQTAVSSYYLMKFARQRHIDITSFFWLKSLTGMHLWRPVSSRRMDSGVLQRFGCSAKFAACFIGRWWRHDCGQQSGFGPRCRHLHQHCQLAVKYFISQASYLMLFSTNFCLLFVGDSFVSLLQLVFGRRPSSATQLKSFQISQWTPPRSCLCFWGPAKSPHTHHKCSLFLTFSC